MADERLLDLLIEFEDRQERGEHVTPEMLCREHPDLLPALRRHLAGLVRLRPWFSPDNTAAHVPAVDPGEMPAIPGYEILGELGRGGMGVVYKARDLNLPRTVAIKMLLGGGVLTERQLARFRTEAESVARLSHPGIVAIHQVGEIEGKPYLVLEFVGGGNLDRRISDQPQPAREAARIVRDLAFGMHAAHQAGVLHRDLKPANILLDASGAAKITDFSLAKNLEASGGLTQPLEVVGTPCYLAPEQADRTVAPQGVGVDVYGLGGILYKMLTGRPPFVGESLQDILLQVVGHDPIPPSRLVPRVPRDLEAICLKCLEKRPGARYASAQELADDLEAFLDDRPVKARPLTRWRRAVRWSRRRPVLTALLAGLLLSIVALGVFGFLAYDASLRATAFQRLSDDQQEAIGDLQDRADDLRTRLKEGTTELTTVRAQSKVARTQLAEALNEANLVRYATLIRQGHGAWKRDQRELFHNQWLRCFARSRSADLGFEFRYLGHLLSTPGAGGWKGEIGFVTGLRTPDGKQMVVANARGGVRVYSVPEGKLLSVLVDDAPRVIPLALRIQLAITADGRSLACLPATGNVRVFNLLTPNSKPIIVGTKAAEAMTLLTGKQLLIAEADGFIRRYAPATGKEEGKPIPITRVFGGLMAVDRLVASPDGKWLAGRMGGGSPRLWDLEKNEQKSIPNLSGYPASGLAFSPDSRLLAIGLKHPRARILLVDPTAPERPRTLRDRGASVTDVRFDTTGERLAVADDQGVLRLLDVQSGERIVTLKGHDSSIYALDWTGQRLASMGADARVLFWDRLQSQDHDTLSSAPRLRVHRLMFTPDSNFVLGAGPAFTPPHRDAELKAWDVRLGGGPTRVFQNVARGFLMSAMSPDGKTLATALSMPNTPNGPSQIWLWDVATGKRLVTMEGHSTGVYALVFSPDGKTLASGGGVVVGTGPPGEVHLWDVAKRRLRFSLPTQPGAVVGLAFDAEGKRLASGSLASGKGKMGALRVWDLATRKSTREILFNGPSPTGVGFINAGKEVLACTGGLMDLKPGVVQRYDLSTGKMLAEWSGHSWPIMCGCLTPDRKMFATGDMLGQVRLWDVGKGKTLHTMTVPGLMVGTLNFSADGKRLAAGCGMEIPDSGRKGQATVWEVATAMKKADFVTDDFNAVALSKDGKHVYSGTTVSGRLLEGNVETKKIDRVLLDTPKLAVGHRVAILSQAIAEGGKTLISGDIGGEVKIWDWKTRQVIGSLPNRKAPVSSLVVAKDGRTLAVGTGGLVTWDQKETGKGIRYQAGKVELWDIATRKPGKVLMRHNRGIMALSWLPDGQSLAVALAPDPERERPGDVVVIDARTGNELARLDRGVERASSLVGSPDGTLLAIGDGTGEAVLWRWRTKEVKRWQPNGRGALAGLAFTPDGKTLATGGADRTIKLWQVATREELLTLETPGEVTALAFSPDGKTMVSASSGLLGSRLQIWRTLRVPARNRW